jgi:hypothetical protein
LSTQKFSATIAKSGSKIYIELPFDPDERWGAKQRRHVTGSINGCTIRGPLDKAR